MNWPGRMRQSRRWLGMAFTATVAANFVAMAVCSGAPPPWVTYAPLPVLLLMLLSGLYLFALPYWVKRRTSR